MRSVGHDQLEGGVVLARREVNEVDTARHALAIVGQQIPVDLTHSPDGRDLIDVLIRRLDSAAMRD